jgi:hypothetical protein
MVKITVTEEVPSQLCRGANIKGAPDWRREKMCTGPTSDEALDDDCKNIAAKLQFSTASHRYGLRGHLANTNRKKATSAPPQTVVQV